MEDEPEERPKIRFNSASKVMKQGESKSTSLSSSSSGSSLNRHNTDTKFPGDILKHRRHSIKDKPIRGRINYKQFLTVEEEGEEQDKNEQSHNHPRKLPRFTIFNDRREFNASQHSFRMSRCKSVGTLTKVDEQKKEEEENKRLVGKLNNLLDKDEFNLRKSMCNTNHQSTHENMEVYQHIGTIGEIREAQEPKDDRAAQPEKSTIGNQLQKIIVDEIDDKKKHWDERQRQEPVIESIIEERNDDEYVDQTLRGVLERLHEETDFIKKMNNSDEVREDMLPVESENITLLTEAIKEENETQNEV